MDEAERKRIGWTTRINLRPAAREQVKVIARDERVSIATVIGHAIEAYVTIRSTA
jgi:hypothetical protein